ncbi:PPP family 3-phenylpropionic acid transporter [Rhodoblastus acidophilus]|uniref:MFS transporter n=1 Tax=Rhodoblastus acidophilus TaxID=1074 RepID=UPI0022252C46|nr:PPP family 3-phenylpropionic acid transporter [Rhodoblastus acidophilus]
MSGGGWRKGSAARLTLLFTLLYAGFGALSPFLPPLLQARGLPPETIGAVIGAGVVARMAVAPILGHAADARRAVCRALAGACACSAVAAALYAAPLAGTALVALALAQAAAQAPTAPFADASAVSAAARENFSYGRIRGLGSAAFILGSLAGGALAARFGATAPALAQAALLAAAALAALYAPEPAARAAAPNGPGTAMRWTELFALGDFRVVVGIAALALGSHALHDGFAMIYWTQAGASPFVASVLWSESVAAEVLVFLAVGPALLRRLGERGAFALAIGAAVLRWSVMASTAAPSAMALVEPLHGLSFALLHLTAMAVIGRAVPAASAALAQSLYGALGVGAATAALSLVSGVLFGRYGGAAFWAMAAMAGLALPLVFALSQPDGRRVRGGGSDR